MPIRCYWKTRAITSGRTKIRNLVEAFEAALTKLGLQDRKNPATMLVARAIIDVAKKGERESDPASAKRRSKPSLRRLRSPDERPHTRA